MAQERSQGPGPEKLLMFAQAPADFAAAVKQRFDDFATAQSKLLGVLGEANRQWLDRMQTEANLASEFTAKLSQASSIPDAMTVYQQWGNRHLELMADDAWRAMGTAQKFIQAGARIVADGPASKSPNLNT